MTLLPPESTSSPHTVSRWLRCGPVACLLLTLVGCVSPWERSALMGGRDTTIDNVQGPTERRLRNLFKKQQEEDEYANSNGSLKPIPGTDDYLAAEKIYEAGEYETAAKAFHKVAKKYKKSEIREDALFMEAEASYQIQHYADAQDKYSELLKDFPSTRHLDDVSQRLFEIARMWLDFPEAAQLSEVQQVNYDEPGQKLPAENPPEKKGWGSVVWPNLTDESRPLFDPEGNGVAALRLIWLNDPTGPLADDALMLAASHYARTGNFIEADRHFTLLREEYPNSQHVQTAFVLGSHVKLMSYEGPNYDEKSLNDAESLKESTLRLYPNIEDRERIEAELRKIELEKAARDWELVVFHGRKNNPRAQAIYCHLLIQRFPNTPYADMAKKRLKELGPEYNSGVALLNPQPDQPKYRQTFNSNRPKLSNTPSALREQPTSSIPTRPESTDDVEASQPTDETAPPKAPRRFFPWGGERSIEDADEPAEPESPGDEYLEPNERTIADEQAASTGGGWTRMLSPRRLFPSREAKPIIEEEPALDEMSETDDNTEE